MRQHRDIEELTGAYALDAVDSEEAEIVELHLRECPPCRDDVAGYRDIARHIGAALAPVPSEVWDAITVRLEPGKHHQLERSVTVETFSPAPPAPPAPPASVAAGRRLAGSGRRVGSGFAGGRLAWFVPTALALAAGLHVAAAYDHRRQTAAVAFFVAAAVVQLTSALAWHVWPLRVTRLVVVVSTLTLIATWVVSRTAGIALGHPGGGREAVGLLDAVVVAAEVAVLLGAITIPMSRRMRSRRAAFALSFSVAVCAAATAAAAVPGPSGHHGEQHPPPAAKEANGAAHEAAPHRCHSSACSPHPHP